MPSFAWASFMPCAIIAFTLRCASTADGDVASAVRSPTSTSGGSDTDPSADKCRCVRFADASPDAGACAQTGVADNAKTAIT